MKEKDPVETARSNYKLGKSLYEQKAYGMAISALEEAIRLDPGKAAYYLQLGVCGTRKVVLPGKIKSQGRILFYKGPSTGPQ